MTNADIIYRAMILMARANAAAKGNGKTERLEWRKVRIDYYPMSNTWGWFGREGLATKHDVLMAINESLGL